MVKASLSPISRLFDGKKRVLVVGWGSGSTLYAPRYPDGVDNFAIDLVPPGVEMDTSAKVLYERRVSSRLYRELERRGFISLMMGRQRERVSLVSQERLFDKSVLGEVEEIAAAVLLMED